MKQYRLPILGETILMLSIVLGSCTHSPESRLPAGRSQPIFTVSPMDIESISCIVLLGNLNPPGHVFPTDHIYFYISNPDGDNRPNIVTLYWLGDLTVTAIEASEHVTAGFVDYSITLRPCEDITVVLSHLSSLSTEIFGDTSAFDTWTLMNEYSTGGKPTEAGEKPALFK